MESTASSQVHDFSVVFRECMRSKGRVQRVVWHLRGEPQSWPLRGALMTPLGDVEHVFCPMTYVVWRRTGEKLPLTHLDQAGLTLGLSPYAQKAIREASDWHWQEDSPVDQKDRDHLRLVLLMATGTYDRKRGRI